MATQLRQLQVQPSDPVLDVNDKLPLSQALRDNSQSVLDDLNANRSILNVIKDATQTGNYFDPLPTLADGTTRGIKQLGTKQVALETKTILSDVVVAANITVPSGANYVILSVGNSQAPASTIAIGPSTLGAVVAQSTNNGAQFAANELSQVAGADSFSPKNLCLIRRADNEEVAEAASANNADIYALLQVESTATDGGAFNDTSGGARVKLSFVIRDFVNKVYTPAPASDIGGLAINYTYALRGNLLSLPETAWNGRGRYVQNVGQTDITVTRAVANQGATPVPVSASLQFQLAQNAFFKVQSSNGGTDYFAISPGASSVAAALNTSTFAVNTTSVVPFSQGITAAGSTGAVNVGVTPNQVDAAGLVIAATGTNPLLVKSAAAVAFKDGFLGSSTWVSTQLNLANSASDWTSLKTVFGETSLAQMILKASQNSNHKLVWADVVGGKIAAGTNITGSGASANLNKTMPDYSMVSDPTVSVKVWLNGELLRPGMSASDNCDYYPGTNRATGDLVLLRPLYGTSTGHSDVLTLECLGTA